MLGGVKSKDDKHYKEKYHRHQVEKNDYKQKLYQIPIFKLRINESL